MFFKHNTPTLIYKGKLNRTTKDHTEFMVAHQEKGVLMMPPATLEEVQFEKKHLDHDIQMCNLEQLLNRMIIDNGTLYTKNAVLNLLKTMGG